MWDRADVIPKLTFVNDNVRSFTDSFATDDNDSKTDQPTMFTLTLQANTTNLASKYYVVFILYFEQVQRNS